MDKKNCKTGKRTKRQVEKILMVIDVKREIIDILQITNRRFMYNPQTGTLILGDEMYGKSICSSHAQEFHASQAEGRFDDYLRGWIGVSKSYPHGIVHFAPAVSMEQFDCGFDALQMFARLEGVNEGKYSINSLVYWVTYVHNVVYSFYRSMIYCYINSTQRCAGSIVIDIIPTNGADKRKFFPFAPYFPVTNVIKRYFYPYFPAIIGIKGYSFPYFPYLSGIMKIKTALYSLFSRLDWHKTVVFPCLGEIYEGIRSLSWEIPVT